MKLTAKEIADIIQGEISGEREKTVTGVASLSEATSEDLSFLDNPKYANDLPSCQAGIILLRKEITPPNGMTAIFVKNPQFAFSKILELLAKEKEEIFTGIHPTTLVSKNAKIAPNVSIGAYCVIEPEVTIAEGTQIGPQCYIGKKSSLGKNCKIYPRVTVREEIVIGNRVIIHSGTVIGSDGFGYVTVEKIHHKIPQIGTVKIEDEVEIGANVTIDRATIGETVIGRGTKIDNLVQIAHNVKVGEGSIIAAQTGIAGSCNLGNFVILAGQVGIADHITVGEGSIMAAQSGIINDLPAGSVVFGTPSREIQKQRKIEAILSRLPEIYSDFKKMKKIMKLEEK